MSYSEAIRILDPPRELSFVLGLTRLEFHEGEEIWFRDGRAFLGRNVPRLNLPHVDNYSQVHDHFDGDKCDVRSSLHKPYHWEITTAGLGSRKRFVLGDSAEQSTEGLVYQCGFLRGIRGAQHVSFSAGCQDVSCAHIAFEVGGRPDMVAPTNGWFSPLRYLKVRMLDGLVAELELYVDDEALFRAIEAGLRTRYQSVN